MNMITQQRRPDLKQDISNSGSSCLVLRVVHVHLNPETLQNTLEWSGICRRAAWVPGIILSDDADFLLTTVCLDDIIFTRGVLFIIHVSFRFWNRPDVRSWSVVIISYHISGCGDFVEDSASLDECVDDANVEQYVTVTSPSHQQCEYVTTPSAYKHSKPVYSINIDIRNGSIISSKLQILVL